jgi:short-chain fatty acids transporter
MSSPPADSSSPPGRLERIALRFTDIAERWLPDAFVFALLATIAVVGAGLTYGGASPARIAEIWGRG